MGKRHEDLKKTESAWDGYLTSAVAGFIIGAYCFYRYSLWTRTGG